MHTQQRFLKQRMNSCSRTGMTYFSCRMLLTSTNEASKEALKDLTAGKLRKVFEQRRQEKFANGLTGELKRESH